MGYGLKDALLKETKALPNGAATVYTDPLDLEITAAGELVAEVEFQLVAPVLTTTEIGDTQTITYSIQTDDDVAFGSPTTLYSSVLVQTGAGGAGAAAATHKFRLPSETERYVRARAVKAGATNASTASMTLEAIF